MTFHIFPLYPPKPYPTVSTIMKQNISFWILVPALFFLIFFFFEVAHGSWVIFRPLSWPSHFRSRNQYTRLCRKFIILDVWTSSTSFQPSIIASISVFGCLFQPGTNAMHTAQPCGPLHSFRREDQCFGWSCGSMAQCLHLSSGRESGWMAFFDVWCWANPVHQIYPNIVPFPAECRQM